MGNQCCAPATNSGQIPLNLKKHRTGKGSIKKQATDKPLEAQMDIYLNSEGTTRRRSEIKKHSYSESKIEGINYIKVAPQTPDKLSRLSQYNKHAGDGANRANSMLHGQYTTEHSYTDVGNGTLNDTSSEINYEKVTNTLRFHRHNQDGSLVTQNRQEETTGVSEPQSPQVITPDAKSSQQQAPDSTLQSSSSHNKEDHNGKFTITDVDCDKIGGQALVTNQATDVYDSMVIEPLQEQEFLRHKQQHMLELDQIDERMSRDEQSHYTRMLLNGDEDPASHSIYESRGTLPTQSFVHNGRDVSNGIPGTYTPSRYMDTMPLERPSLYEKPGPQLLSPRGPYDGKQNQNRDGGRLDDENSKSTKISRSNYKELINMIEDKLEQRQSKIKDREPSEQSRPTIHQTNDDNQQQQDDEEEDEDLVHIDLNLDEINQMNDQNLDFDDFEESENISQNEQLEEDQKENAKERMSSHSSFSSHSSEEENGKPNEPLPDDVLQNLASAGLLNKLNKNDAQQTKTPTKSGLLSPAMLRHRSILYTPQKEGPLRKTAGGMGTSAIRPPSQTRQQQRILPSVSGKPSPLVKKNTSLSVTRRMSTVRGGSSSSPHQTGLSLAFSNKKFSAGKGNTTITASPFAGAPMVLRRQSTAAFLNPSALAEPKPEPKPAIPTFSTDKKEIETMLNNYIRQNKVKVPFQPLDGNKYLFGTKIIHASIINGGLSVRVGGGYMTIDELITQHSNTEIYKLRTLAAKEKKKIPKIIQELSDKYRHSKKQFVQ